MTHSIHQGHDHVHGANCGHLSVQHAGHIDYLHDGHLHNIHGDHIDEHTIAVDATNPVQCTPSHRCTGHAANHVHGPSCGHPSVPHGDHTDYLVEGHLHHVHSGHCDDHGPLRVA